MSRMENFQPAPPAAISRVLATFDRDQLEAFIEVAIGLLDLADGERTPPTPRTKGFRLSPLRSLARLPAARSQTQEAATTTAPSLTTISDTQAPALRAGA